MDKHVFKILVVDDEPDVRDVLARFLPRRLNVNVSVCDNGSLAVETARTWKPDLVLLDIHLPGHMGWDVLREIRSFDPDVKIVIVTGLFEVPQEDQEILLQQASGYMTKPLDLEEVFHKIIEALGAEVKK